MLFGPWIVRRSVHYHWYSLLDTSQKIPFPKTRRQVQQGFQTLKGPTPLVRPQSRHRGKKPPFLHKSSVLQNGRTQQRSPKTLLRASRTLQSPHLRGPLLNYVRHHHVTIYRVAENHNKHFRTNCRLLKLVWWCSQSKRKTPHELVLLLWDRCMECGGLMYRNWA